MRTPSAVLECSGVSPHEQAVARATRPAITRPGRRGAWRESMRSSGGSVARFRNDSACRADARSRTEDEAPQELDDDPGASPVALGVDVGEHELRAAREPLPEREGPAQAQVGAAVVARAVEHIRVALAADPGDPEARCETTLGSGRSEAQAREDAREIVAARALVAELLTIHAELEGEDSVLERRQALLEGEPAAQ